jgi:hypothetical protein
MSKARTAARATNKRTHPHDKNICVALSRSRHVLVLLA